MPELRAGDFALGRKLNVGVPTMCSVVVEATHRPSGASVTLKMYQCPLSDNVVHHLATERQILCFVDPALSPRLIGAFADSTGFVLVFDRDEKANMLSLSELDWSNDRERKVRKVMETLWEHCGVVHGDVKADNWLVDFRGDATTEKFYLIDYGSAARFDKDDRGRSLYLEDRSALDQMLQLWKQNTPGARESP